MSNRNFRYTVYLRGSTKEEGKPDYYASKVEYTDSEVKLECLNKDGSIRRVSIAKDQLRVVEDLGEVKE